MNIMLKFLRVFVPIMIWLYVNQRDQISTMFCFMAHVCAQGMLLLMVCAYITRVTVVGLIEWDQYSGHVRLGSFQYLCM